MSSNINLVSISKTEGRGRENLIRNLRIASIISVIGVGTISISLFVILQGLYPAPVIKQEQEVIKSISSFRDREGKLILVKNKVKGVEEVITKRQKYDEVLRNVSDQIPSGVAIGNLSINDTRLSLSVSSNSLLLIDETINNLYGIVLDNKIIKNFTIENISADPSSSGYSMSISGERI